MEIEFDALNFDRITNHWTPSAQFFAEPTDMTDCLNKDIPARVRALQFLYFLYQDDLQFYFGIVALKREDTMYVNMIVRDDKTVASE